MDGKATKLVKYLDGSDKRFIIPVYQRNYISATFSVLEMQCSPFSSAIFGN